MNFKRKRSKRQVKCTICTKFTWLGNHKERKPIRDHRVAQKQLQDWPS